MTEESRISTIEDKINQVGGLITIGRSEGSRLGQRSKRQIEQWLEAEARLLIDKRERHHQKQDRLQQLQEDFERQRREKEQKIGRKLDVSSRNRTREVAGVRKRLTDQSKRHRSVLARFQDGEASKMEGWLSQRKTYEQGEAERSRSKMSQSSRSSSSSSRYRRVEPPPDEQIQKQMTEISAKLAKAQERRQHRDEPFLTKVHTHNTAALQVHQERASQQVEHQKATFSHKLAFKIAAAENNRRRLSESLSLAQRRKQESYQQKLSSYQQNLRSLEGRKLDRMQQLNRKFEKSAGAEKAWRNERQQAYYQRFLANQSLLEQQKARRAESILEKHQELTARNQVYRQRKDSLFKAIKCDPRGY